MVIYSVITNDYDTPKPIFSRSIPHILFTDNPNIIAPGWEIVKVKKTKCQRLQRRIKILGHPALEEYSTTIYVDASIVAKATFQNLIKSYRGGLIIGSHPTRSCVYAEGLAVKSLNKAPEEVVNSQIAEYYSSGFPINFGMWQTGFMIRDRSCDKLNEIWHDKLSEHSHRDQLSLPWAIKESGVKPQSINMAQFMVVRPHKTKEPPKVFYSTPFRSDKNIGRANNEFIELLPDDSWVCITDADACFMHPDFGTKIEQIIMDNTDFDLIGCTTNRLGGLHQLHEGQFNEDMDGYKHYDISNDLWKENGSKVIETSGVAGVFMLFSKDTWKRAGGFKEKIITADTEFNKSIKKSGGKIGLATGLYIFHLYRLWEKSHAKAWRSVSHLR